MKKLILLLAIGCAVFFYMNREEDKPKKIIRIGVECAYVPNNWEETKPTESNLPIANDEGLYAEGYDVQIAKLVSEKLNLQPQIMKIDWENLIDALNEGEIDAIFSGMTDTSERKRSINFSETYSIKSTEYAIMIQKTSPFANASKLSDFAGARILGQRGTKLDEVIEQIPRVIHVRPADSIPEMVKQLLANRVDGVVINLDTAHSHMRNDKNITVVSFIKGDGFELDFTGACVGVRKSDETLLAKINEAIESISKRDRQKIMDQTLARVWKNL